MKVISWNVKFDNSTAEQSINKLLENEQADVFCFQEINKDILKFLKNKHQFQLHYELETTKNLNQTNELKTYVVILSKYVILNKGKVHIVEPNKKISKVTKYLQKYLKKHSTMFENYTSEYAIYIDIKRLSDHKQFRIFNTHLKRFTTPINRIHQFKKLIHIMDRTKQNIICGDFNIMDTFLSKFSGTIFNSSLKDNFKFNERNEFEDIFKIHKFQNPFSKQSTFNFKKIINLQLDHILVPEHTKVKNQKVLEIKKYNSDHAPIYLEIE
ncbi:MAG: hypothetical protein HRU03_05420 [Nanoarchaeales archaeon]|nr:hypothetical protein [Nanoarchaeales archaeon]